MLGHFTVPFEYHKQNIKCCAYLSSERGVAANAQFTFRLKCFGYRKVPARQEARNQKKTKTKKRRKNKEVKAEVAVAATAVWQLLQGAELLGSVANIV